jgi:hypothetical protein
MPNANPTSPHKKTAHTMLKAGIGLAEADAEFPEDARNERSFVKRPSPLETARFPMSESRRIMGVPRCPKVSTERGVKRYASHSSWRYCARFSASLCAAAAAAWRYRERPGTRRTRPPPGARW